MAHLGPCWVWEAAVSARGYGVFNNDGSGNGLAGTHRIAYELVVGPIPDGLLVLHHCDNRRCVRPDHLFVGTYTDNNRDTAAKGRIGTQQHPEIVRRGSQQSQAKLTEAQVLEIRALAGTGLTQQEIGKRFGVSQHGISNILSRKNWRHV